MGIEAAVNPPSNVIPLHANLPPRGPTPPTHADIIARVAKVEAAVVSLRRLGWALGAGILATTAPESWLGRAVAIASSYLGV